MGDVILMLDDALGDRDHDAETAWYCDVGGVSRGDIPVRTAGGPRGAWVTPRHKIPLT
jgi:hypothetical protein